MLNFRPVTADDRELYSKYLAAANKRGCEYSFLNVFLWGEQQLSLTDDCLILLSRFGDLLAYSYPLGSGDIKAALEKIIVDAKERGISCRLHGIVAAEKEFIEREFPCRFSFSTSIDSYDYIYSIDSLSTLSGKKLHSKRNFINRFTENYPDAETVAVTPDNVGQIYEMALDWFNEREKLVEKGAFDLERDAIKRMCENFHKLRAEGLILKANDDLLAFTVGSPFYPDTFDVHFEKASRDTDGAYAYINREFARYIKEKYPEVKYLDREEDMGLEGLRRAKQSYRPLYQVEKWRAELLEEK